MHATGHGEIHDAHAQSDYGVSGATLESQVAVGRFYWQIVAGAQQAQEIILMFNSIGEVH